MHNFNSHGATDVTGFGILGHAQNLAKQQESDVTFIIHNLPILNKMAAVAKACGNMFGLLDGTSAETSGNSYEFCGFRASQHDSFYLKFHNSHVGRYLTLVGAIPYRNQTNLPFPTLFFIFQTISLNNWQCNHIFPR